MNKLDKLMNERVQETISAEILDWSKLHNEIRIHAIYYNDVELIALSKKAMEGWRGAIRRLLDLRMNPIVSKPLWIGDTDV